MPVLDDLLQEYCKLAGRDYPMAEWKFAVSFSAFRVSLALLKARPSQAASRPFPC